MEKKEIIEKLSSYFKLKGSEAESIYNEIFYEIRENPASFSSRNRETTVKNHAGNGRNWNSYGSETGDITISIQTDDENQLEFEYQPKAVQRSAEIQEMEKELKSRNVLIPLKELVLRTEKDESISETDKSYYIWHKDAEPEVQDMESLTCEYELLYQAAKEVEYKSKMKIYVVSFISFFSFVLLMLVLSPVIYKQFFFAEQFPSLQQTIMGGREEQKAMPNNLNNLTLADERTSNAFESRTLQDRGNEDLVRSQSEQNVKVNENIEPVSPKPTLPNVTGGKTGELRKTSFGWTDNKYNVVYIELGNGKYSIQESSWDSYDKAKSRKSEIESLGIPGLKGNIDAVDLGKKGKWYRVKFGEFNSIDDARRKVEEFMRL